MKILAVDTSTESCSVALIESVSLSRDSEMKSLAELTIVSKITHSRHLMKMVDTVVRDSGIHIHDLDGFAVATGPGSFTGIRIGISTVKGLVLASGKPVVGISNLDALAYPFSFSPYLICTLMDARRGEVYCCSFRSDEKGILKKERNEQVLSPEKAIADINEPCLFVGNGALFYKNLIKEKISGLAHFVPPCQNIIRASAIAYLGMERLKENDTDDIAALAPNYVRKSEAEILNIKVQ